MQSISTLFEEFSFRPRKSQGQNFLTDPQVLDRIDRAIQCPPEDILLEVGGGYGALTDRLVRKEVSLTVVEPDHKLFAMLERKFGQNPAISLVKADILKLDLASLKPQGPGLLTIAGNIPYYLTSPLITRLLTQYHPLIRAIYLMVQKEVADRLVARPGTKSYGALTLFCQYYGQVEKLLEVPARCFRPKPKVDSAFIKIGVKKAFPLEGDAERKFFSLVRAIFQGRRKMLSNSLKSLGKSLEKIDRALSVTGIDPQVRGEQLALDQLVELSRALESP
jgi:16S rRNA (adenine1518-N6/adenine1519-N6)-dimethyltransferase